MSIFQAYHGSAEVDIASFALQCIAGDGAYSALWDKEEETGVTTLTLKKSICHREEFRYISGSSITIASISVANQKSSVLIDGRAIFNTGKKVLKNCKKALAFEKQFLRNGQMPSGSNEEDLDKYILDGMIKALKASGADENDDPDSPSSENNNNNDEAVGTDASRRPHYW